MPTLKPNKTELIIGKIFRDQSLTYGLHEFEEIDLEGTLDITETDQGRFSIKDLRTGQSRFVFDETTGLGRPEETVRQLWLHKLNKQYGYPLDRIDTEKSIHFGREVHKKAVDIVVYKEDKVTPFIVIEVKSPTQDKGIDQLKSYLNAEGCEIGVWSNGVAKVILYRNYPNNFDDTLSEIPSVKQTIDDIFREKKTLGNLDPKFELKRAIEIMEELVLANAGVDVFTEVFKLIYAKLLDEIEAEKRPDQEVYFRKYRDPQKTYSSINSLFKNSITKWPGIFFETDNIRLSPEHLSVVVGEMERARLFGADLSIVDEAFEYLIPEVAKGKKGQYFTPRHVIAMMVQMLDPRPTEYILDPAAGSGGFLIGAMNYVQNKYFKNSKPDKKDYAQKYLYGIDFADETAKVSRALMLIAGDGRSHLFKLNSLDPREWQGEQEEKMQARVELRKRLAKLDDYNNNEENQKNFKQFAFDLLLTNPPFAGELKEPGLLRQYEFGKKNGKLVNKIERHILFIERALELVRPGGRLGIVLPQGVFNNTNMQYVREWLFDKARILAVVGLHVNTFKPHTGTKTSVLFLQKWGGEAGNPLADYPIFMAVSQLSGKDNSGQYVYKKDSLGKHVYDFHHHHVLDHDLDEIVSSYQKFTKNNSNKWTTQLSSNPN